jgi:NAD(P)-dependent dehydrogenase (short-subunit alcohol dehydrogenase family)
MIAGNKKSVLVTGGAKRIGQSIAAQLAKEGWFVAVHYGTALTEAQQTVARITALGGRAVAVQADLANEEEVKTLLSRAAELLEVSLSDFACVVNNASIFEKDTAFDFSGAALQRHMQINVTAPLLLAQALYDATPSDAQSVVINLLDQKLFNLNPDFLSYTLSKSALHTATDLLARALAPKVRVVGVAPGITLVSGEQTQEAFEKAHRCTPLGYSSTPDDIATTVCFLAKNKAVTGTTWVVDGGQHLLSSPRDVMFMTNSSLG